MTEIRYNEDNKYENKEWAEDGGVVVERINTNELEHVTKADCTHARTKQQPADDFDEGIVEVKCQDCPLGWFVKA